MNKLIKKYFISIFIILFIALFYIIVILYIQNKDLLNNTLFNNYPARYKLKIITGIFTSVFYSYPVFQLLTLILISVLTGLNIVLITRKITYLRSSGKLKIMLGGSALLGLAASSCSACALPFLAFIGLGGSLAFLPLKGEEFSLLTIFLLILSAIIIIRNKNNRMKCDIPRPKKKKMV